MEVFGIDRNLEWDPHGKQVGRVHIFSADLCLLSPVIITVLNITSKANSKIYFKLAWIKSKQREQEIWQRFTVFFFQVIWAHFLIVQV